ncbi:cytokinin dehydrogenase 3-like [Telopea speciosissima]|uniref:cytokinin dehydrogenase 3-like n=1 Tax=Telopea speciosissima TaxID=54955 RepID=UPI001CC64899|nr:cytokinin dehydrogenase 3-like [Telopea speciosissima]
MEFSMFYTRISFLILLILLSSPSKFIQSPMDFGPLNLLPSTDTAALDFGRIYFNSPSAVLRPQSPKEISLLLNSLSGSSFSKVTVAARGAGHSINGQAQALNGIVVEMDSLPPSIKIRKRVDGESSPSYVDVSGGTLWIDLLKETLKEGLAPRSWTDYLYLTIGGTLSNAGISGQTFKYGPQISNVLQLDVVTGTGEIVTCSPSKNSELFYGILGGLGQFGIITSARILLQDAPRKVKWVRAFYDDFDIFTKDQELLIKMESKVDYLEGFIVLNKDSLHGSSISFPFPANLASIPQFKSDPSKVYYCIEFAVNDKPDKYTNLDQVVEEISSKLSFMPSVQYSVEVSYFDFLNRVRMEELSLREIGLWDVSHPWLNMFVPKSGIAQFRDLLLENISPSTFEGPILIYPISRDKWNLNMSAVLPESDSGENTLYIVGILRSANPNSCSQECLQGYLRQNRNITDIATDPTAGIGAKQYLSHHTKKEQWMEHFGGKWQQFLARKSSFDPLNILAPGQAIFKRRYSMNPTTTTTPLTLSSQ